MSCNFFVGTTKRIFSLCRGLIVIMNEPLKPVGLRSLLFIQLDAQLDCSKGMLKLTLKFTLKLLLHSGEISPTRCNNCDFILLNGFTLHVSGDNLTHHQEYNAVYGHR